MLYYRNAWEKIPYFQPEKYPAEQLPFISVIISARNEALRISACLTSLAEQEYPCRRYEVIVVNDHSEDDTVAVVESFATSHPNIRLVDLAEVLRGKKINSYKKKAIETGIGLANGEIILTTDADCVAGPFWLETIAAGYIEKQAVMIAAPVKFLTGPSYNIFQKIFFIFQATDFMTLQGITGAAISKKLHYMANGANFSYTKKIFREVNGFAGIDNLASGDDMFLMEKVGFGRHIIYLKSTNAIVSTMPEPTIRAFFNQRIRWAGKTSSYKNYRIKLILALIYFLNIWVVVLVISSFLSYHIFYDLLIFLALKIMAELLFLFPVSHFFDQRKLLWLFIPLQPFHILYVIVAGWLGTFGSYRWKERRVR